MNSTDHTDAPAAYSRDSVLAYLRAAELERTRIHEGIARAHARTTRARKKAERLGVLQSETDRWGIPATPKPQPVPTLEVGRASPATDPFGVQSEESQPCEPVDPLPSQSVRPTSLVFEKEPVDQWQLIAADSPIAGRRITSPLGR